jgi:hypothetical protein
VPIIARAARRALTRGAFVQHSDLRHAAVDEDLGAVDEARVARGEEYCDSTASSNIQLAFFNACYSKAEAVVQHVPAAIGMNTAIGDDAARVFAAQFYSAIGFGLSVGTRQGALMLEGIPEELTPELFLTPGLDQDALVLVKAERRVADRA